jgi:phosphoglycolate phosphatase
MTARKFDLLVFDWDGTLVDSTAHIASSLQAACADLDLPVPSRQAAQHVIGLGLHDALAYVLPDLEAKRYREVADRYRYHFLADDVTIETFPMVDDGIASLEDEGFLLAVATGKSRVGLDRSLGEVNFGSRFVATRCGDEGRPKPHPDMLKYLMDATGVPANRTLMIGDTSHDLMLAANAGASSLAVSYGAHPADSLVEHGPLACLNSFTEVMQWLAENA